MLIPERLVLFEDEKTFVEVPGEGPEAEPSKIAVELGLSDGLNVEIVSGLAEGDQVVQRPPKEISLMNSEFGIRNSEFQRAPPY